MHTQWMSEPGNKKEEVEPEISELGSKQNWTLNLLDKTDLASNKDQAKIQFIKFSIKTFLPTLNYIHTQIKQRPRCSRNVFSSCEIIKYLNVYCLCRPIPTPNERAIMRGLVTRAHSAMHGRLSFKTLPQNNGTITTEAKAVALQLY